MKQATAKELEQMTIGELDKTEDCQGVKSIGIYNVIEPGHPNWAPSFANFGDGDERLCKSALRCYPANPLNWRKSIAWGRGNPCSGMCRDWR